MQHDLETKIWTQFLRCEPQEQLAARRRKNWIPATSAATQFDSPNTTSNDMDFHFHWLGLAPQIITIIEGSQYLDLKILED